MAELFAVSRVSETSPNPGRKCLVFEVPSTGTINDTVTITLGSYGISTYLGLVDLLHTTANSVIVPLAYGQNQSTTAVSSGVLTITIGSGQGKQHTLLIYGK